VSDEKALIDIEKPERAGNGPDPETQALRNSKPYCMMKHGDEWLEIQPTIPISPTTLALADPLFEASRPEKDSASQPMLRVLAGILKGVALLLPCRCHGIHQNSRATLARSSRFSISLLAWKIAHATGWWTESAKVVQARGARGKSRTTHANHVSSRPRAGTEARPYSHGIMRRTLPRRRLRVAEQVG
jgi:hypothetical protein